MSDLTETEIRAVALLVAGDVAEEGCPTGYVLSAARQLEGYIRTGLTQVGPRFRQGIVLGRTGALLRVDGNLSPEEAEAITAVMTHLLTKDGRNEQREETAQRQ
jgi:hypothetical protein